MYVNNNLHVFSFPYEGMVMLPVSDVSSLLNSADPRLLQIVNLNGQPTLQIVGGTSLLTQQVPNTGMTNKVV